MKNDAFDLELGKRRGSSSGQRRFAILRCAKIKNLGNMGASLQHTFRERETPNADARRIHDNTVLHGPSTSADVLDAWKARAPEKIRSNAVHGLEYFVGASPEAMRAMNRAEQDAYFEKALDWLKERHGAENILSAVVHRDEATPHMTVMTIPLDEQGKLNARALVGNREKLSAMQTDFAETVGEDHGLVRGIQGSKATHERVQRVYAHIMDPEASVKLPERHRGAFLGFGGESEAEWQERATEAATDALQGAWKGLQRIRENHRTELMDLRSELNHERVMRAQTRSGEMEASLHRMLDRNRALEHQNEALAAQVQQLTDKAHTVTARYQLIVDRALDYAEDHGLDPDDMVEYLKHGHAQAEQTHDHSHDDDLGHG